MISKCENSKRSKALLQPQDQSLSKDNYFTYLIYQYTLKNS